MRRTLSRRLFAASAALVAGVAVLAGGSLWGLMGLRETVAETTHEYAELRLVEMVQRHLAHARLAALQHDGESVRAQLEAARAQLDAFVRFQETEEPAEPDHQGRESTEAADVRAALAEAEGMFGPAADPGGSEAWLAVLARATRAADELASTTDVAAIAERAGARARAGVWAVAAALLAIVLLCAAVTSAVYRSVMAPVRRLRASVREIASGHLDRRLDAERDQEFADLAADFNRMVGELDALYRTLEQKVAARSRELVRSERLASVGFLAAGVAHEISTPLNVITGYAELSQKDLAALGDQDEVRRVAQSLSVICEESYRCKGIIRQLLTLARRSDGRPSPVALPAVADGVAVMLAGLSRYRDKRVSVNVRRSSPADSLAVVGHEAELKQVLLNLAINALEAVAAGEGRVQIEVDRAGDRVRLAVSDNGVGMGPAVLEHVFEPFFTARADPATRGIGLGLSVTHAIVEAHGGHIHAHSDGPGRGSRFVVDLPAAAAGWPAAGGVGGGESLNGGGEHGRGSRGARGEPARAGG